MDTLDLREVAALCDDALDEADGLSARLPIRQAGAADVERIRRLLGAPADLRVRRIGKAVRAVYLETIVDPRRLDDEVVRPFSRALLRSGERPSAPPGFEAVRTYGEAADALLAGKAVVILAGADGAWVWDVARWPQRQPQEPPAELVSQGPHLGFVEDLATNLALLRKEVPSRRMRVETLAIGRRSRTRVAVVYVQGLARLDLLTEVRRRLSHVEADFITDSGMLSQWLVPRSYLFPAVHTTERPDVAASAVLEGRVIILCDGSPTIVIVPQVFADILHVPEDYYIRPLGATIERTIRFMGFLTALVVSPLYVALLTVNLQLVPTPLFLSIAQARSNVPIPVAAEVLLLEILVEVIRQAGLRVPSSLGQSVSIIGAIVIGQSAVIAGLFSAPAVVVVSLSFIVSFIVPSRDAAMALRLLRFPLILLAAAFGLFGMMWGLMLLLIYLCAIDSFGVPYLAPVSPRRLRGLQDVLWRRPLPAMRRSFLARPPRPQAAGGRKGP
ncbi:MAG: spore germination protein [Firmicutes bacterium]|nr:spore germination protein [Bacillota bacterium]